MKNKRLKTKVKHFDWFKLNFIADTSIWSKKQGLFWPTWKTVKKNGKLKRYVVGHLECRWCHGFGTEYRYYDEAVDGPVTKYFTGPKYDSAGIEFADMYKCRKCGGKAHSGKKYRLR